MNNAELFAKIKAEIERRIKEYDAIIESQPERNRAERDSWKWAECKWVLNLITSLQQEQQDNEDIDKVAQELYEHLYELKRRNNVPTNLYDKQEIIALWKAGIEYAYNHPKQECPMPDSTKLIELWHEDKEMLKEKDFRDDPWRLAYNAFMCGFGRGIAVKKQEQPSLPSNLDEAAEEYSKRVSNGHHYRDLQCGFKAGAEWAFGQGETFNAHKGAFGICFDRSIDALLDSLRDNEKVIVQIRKCDV